jgi:cell division protease FtsH
VLDPALLRPGRFDRRVIVDRPVLDARRAILEVHAKGKPLAPDIDLDVVAGNTPGFSGADLANLVNEATLGATRREAETISNEDFNEAFDKILLGDPSETKLNPKEKRRVAIHEAGHAVAANFSEDSEPLHRVSILPRGMALGVTQQTSGGDRHVRAQPELEARLRVLMGGYAAERLVLGSVSTGAENDLKEATRLASNMVSHYGMGKTLGPAYYEHQAEHPFLGQRMAIDSGESEATLHAIETEARGLLATALAAVTRLLADNRPVLEKLVDALLNKETLEKSELLAILEPSRAERASSARERLQVDSNEPVLPS